MLYIRSPALIHLTTNSLYPLINISLLLPPPSPGNHHSIHYYCEFAFFLIPHISEIIQYLSFSV